MDGESWECQNPQVAICPCRRRSIVTLSRQLTFSRISVRGRHQVRLELKGKRIRKGKRRGQMEKESKNKNTQCHQEKVILPSSKGSTLCDACFREKLEPAGMCLFPASDLHKTHQMVGIPVRARSRTQKTQPLRDHGAHHKKEPEHV